MQVSEDDGIGSETRRFAIEAVAILVDVKTIAVGQLLRPTGVPEDLIQRFMSERNPGTGKKWTKREFAVVLLNELARRGEARMFTDKLIELAAGWTNFHLAHDEIMAHGLVQKALSLRTDLASARARFTAERDQQRRHAEEASRREREAAELRQHDLLLQQFDAAASEMAPQRRGYLLEDSSGRLFALHGIDVLRPFKRNEGGEQIDAAFRLQGWHYIVECRWRAEPADIRQLDGLTGQVSRSGHQTMGLFLSINGWSTKVVPLLKQNAEKRIILMDGYDLRCVLAQQIGLKSLLAEKLSALNLRSEPFLTVAAMQHTSALG